MGGGVNAAPRHQRDPIDEAMAAPTPHPAPARWIEEGLRALAAGGPDAVRIDPLAKALGVTRGGFYWHFEDRARAARRRCSTPGSGPRPTR